MTCERRMVDCRVPLAMLLLLLASCSDDEPGGTAPDVGTDVVEDDTGGRDITVDGIEDEEVEGDAAADVVEDEPIEDVVVDVSSDINDEGIFPDEPTGRCIEDGNGARGTVRFD